MRRWICKGVLCIHHRVAPFLALPFGGTNLEIIAVFVGLPLLNFGNADGATLPLVDFFRPNEHAHEEAVRAIFAGRAAYERLSMI